MAELTREALYELVWQEPMVAIAARYDVSSSYLARVCERLNVPRPERGYWAKLAVGKARKRPPLPELRPGDEFAWSRDGEPRARPRPLPRPPKARALERPPAALGDVHPLLQGVKELFETGRCRRNRPTDTVLTAADLFRPRGVAGRGLGAHQLRPRAGDPQRG